MSSVNTDIVTDGDDNNEQTNNFNTPVLVRSNSELKRLRNKHDEKELVKTLISQKCNNNNVARIHLFDVSDNDDLLEFAKLNNYLEILDSSHDLQRNNEQTNPLYDYYLLNIKGIIFINGLIIQLNDNDIDNHLTQIDNCRTQIAVKNKMKELIQNSACNTAFGRLNYSDSNIQSIEKTLQSLQVELKETEKIPITLIETHRGGDPSNNMIPSIEYSKMYKSEISTIFDLNTSLNNCMMNVFRIYDSEENEIFTTYVNRIIDSGIPNDTFPLLRFYNNYFPNAFSAFIYHNELFDNNYNFVPDTIHKILKTYNDAIKNVSFKKNPTIIESYENEIKNSIKLNRDFFESNPKPIYMLHMFSDDKKDKDQRSGLNISSTNRWTFSIQKGPVTADMVTMELYGIKKRNLSSVIKNAFCNTKVKDYTTALILLSREMSTITKNTHVSNGKLIGDGTCILSAILISFFYDNYIAVLSSDICCCYRALHNTGFAVRQHPSSKLAGMGAGLFTNQRKIEIYKNIEIATFDIKKYNDFITLYYTMYNEYYYNNLYDRLNSSININTFPDLTNTYLSRILLPTVINHYNHFVSDKVNSYLDYYDKKLTISINNQSENTICELIREMYLCPYIKKKPEELCRELINDYMNELQNLINIINDYVMGGVIKIRNIDLDIHIDELIKLVSSIETKLQTIFNHVDGDNDIKINVVFNLLILFKKEKLGNRPIINYINKIVDYIAKIQDIKTALEQDGTIINNYQIVEKYEILYKIFIKKYGYVTRSMIDKYEKRQIAKQPLNILKYLCRANALHETFKENTSLEYTDVFFKIFLMKYGTVKSMYPSFPGTAVTSEANTNVNTLEFISQTPNSMYSPTPSRTSSVNYSVIGPLSTEQNAILTGPPSVLNFTPTTSNNVQPTFDIFNDDQGQTEINDYLSVSLNPETNFTEYINDADENDMDEKEEITYQQYVTENKLNNIINRIEDSPEKESFFKKLSGSLDSLYNKVFTQERRGGSSIIKKQKIKKSQKHKKNKKYTIKKD